VLAAVALAQPADRGRVRITELRLDYKQTPYYDTQTDPRAKRMHDWLQILAEYEAEGGRDGWVDDVSLTWYVAVLPKAGGRPILMQRTVTYVDVERGSHRADIYLRPGFIRRYYGERRIDRDAIAVYVEAKVNGVRSSRIEESKGKFPRNWWETEDPRSIIKKDEELLIRNETPFAPLDYDFYEHIRTSGK